MKLLFYNLIKLANQLLDFYENSKLNVQFHVLKYCYTFLLYSVYGLLT